MNYCKRCVIPDTRPGIVLSADGICTACVGHEEKMDKIDWDLRKDELTSVMERFKDKSASYYDCIVPVSGGKDSTYQVYVMKQVYGMNPITVTYKYADRTELGQANLDNLRRLGVDNLEISPDPEVERKFIRKALIKAGDPCLPDHMGIFSVTLRVAVNYRIPLVVWGENPQLEYGGTVMERDNPYLDREWLSKHGCLQGSFAEDWVDDDLSLEDLFIYRIPTDEELRKAEISSIFLGYYLPWDPLNNFEIAEKLGFKKSPDGPKMGIYDFADLDSTNMIVHHYIKLLKFGMTRLHDNIGVEIRNGRMTRGEGIKILKERGERYPAEEISLLCQYLNLTDDEFWKILEKFRNLRIWKKDGSGKWHIPDLWKGLEDEN